MQYALMIYVEPGYGESLPEADRAAVHAEYAMLAEDPRYVDGVRLQPAEMTTGVRRDGARTLITDGPFADTKEALGGICLIEAADLDEAIELAAGIPAARFGGVVEIRPVVGR